MSVSIGYSIGPRRATLRRSVGRVFSALVDRIDRWAERRRTLVALRSLDQRTRRDIGVAPFGFRRIAGGDVG